MGKERRLEVQISALHTSVPGSCLPLSVFFPDGTTKRYLIDCGFFLEGAKIPIGKPVEPSKKDKKSTSRKHVYRPSNLKDALNCIIPFDASKIDGVVATHAHLDHVGRLALLVKLGFKGEFLMSNSTKKLLPYMLGDSYKIISSEAKRYNSPLLYDQDAVEKTINQSRGYDYGEEIYLDKNIRLNFFMNGHIPGAVVTLIRISPGERFDPNCKDNINILYTGDYCDSNMFFDVKPIPDWVLSLPMIIVTETTYGYMNRSEVKPVFKENISRAVRKRSIIVIPAFSLARDQEIQFTLRQMEDEGLIPKDYSVYTCGKLAKNISRLYEHDGLDNRLECKDFMPYNIQDFSGNAELQQEVLNDGKPKIIIPSGGMGSHGPAQNILPLFLAKKNAVIHFAGYCAKDTLGRKIYETWPGELIEHPSIPPVKKNATVYFTNEFSKHAHQDELLHFLNQFENKLLVLTNHGEKESQKIFVDIAREETYSKDIEIIGSNLYRINSDGLISYYPNKYYSNEIMNLVNKCL